LRWTGFRPTTIADVSHCQKQHHDRQNGQCQQPNGRAYAAAAKPIAGQHHRSVFLNEFRHGRRGCAPIPRLPIQLVENPSNQRIVHLFDRRIADFHVQSEHRQFQFLNGRVQRELRYPSVKAAQSRACDEREIAFRSG
jgi:hypothetical protein